MQTRSRFHVSVEGVTLGDHLIAFSPAGVRHAIYVGKCLVVSVKSGRVSLESLDEFSSGGSLNIFLQKSDFPASEIARRAKSQIGLVLDTIDDNFFCEWCRTGLSITKSI